MADRIDKVGAVHRVEMKIPDAVIDEIENLFGGVAVISDRPVLVGDYCKFGDRMGFVEQIGLRSTRIRTLDRTIVTVPNGQFSAMTLENFSRRSTTWFHPRLSLSRESSPAQVRRVLDAVSNVIASDPKVEPGTFWVRFAAVGPYSLARFRRIGLYLDVQR